MGGPQSRSGRVRKILSPPGFDPRTGQPVASRYTDWAIPTPYDEVGGVPIFSFYIYDVILILDTVVEICQEIKHVIP